MKKLGFGVLGLLAVGTFYYFTTGATQIAMQMKQQVNKALTLASTNGFGITEKKSTPKSEHFILSFNDPAKMTTFLNTQGVQLSTEDAEALKGLKLGIDIAYLADTYSAVSMDVYPLTLPSAVHEAAQTANEKRTITQLSEILKKKALLLHIDLNKVGTGFRGYLKNISETIQSNTIVKINLKGLTFHGDLKNHKLHSVNQALQHIQVTVDDELDITLNKMQSTYLITGETPYDYKSQYTVASLKLVDKNSKSDFSILMEQIDITSYSSVNDTLASGAMQTMTKKITLNKQDKTTTWKNFHIDTNVSNLDISAFEKLQQQKTDNKEESNKALQQLISKGVTINIVDISAENIQHEGENLEDFQITAHLNIDKSLNIAAANQNPLTLLDAIDANLKIVLSKPLFSTLASEPKIMMAAMLFQPKEVKKKKVYSLELKDAKVTVNGMGIN